MRHPHSTFETARKCFLKRISKKADQRLQAIVMRPPRKYRQVLHNPPVEQKIGQVTIFIFADAIDIK